jgi:hypothetical protein
MQRSRSTRTAPRLAIPRAPAVGWAAQFHGDSGLGGVAPIVMPGRVIRVGELRGSVNCVLVAALLVAPSVLAQPLGEIENFNGRRLDDTGWSKVSGTKWKCNDTSNQRWSSSLEGYDSAGFPMYQIKNDWSGLCLDAGSWKPGTGTRVQQWACHRPATANQEWGLSDPVREPPRRFHLQRGDAQLAWARRGEPQHPVGRSDPALGLKRSRQPDLVLHL